MNCHGCGSELDPSTEQVNAAVDEVLSSSLKDAEKSGGVCPLCGHDKKIPYSNRKTVLFGLLIACLLGIVNLRINMADSRASQRAEVAKDVVKRLSANATVANLLGTPISADKKVLGVLKQDETGWQEARLTIPLHGSKADGTAQVVGGRETGSWQYSTFEVEIPALQKKVDVVSGRVVEFDPSAYVDIHTQAAGVPRYISALITPASLDGTFPCVSLNFDIGQVASLGKCAMPTARNESLDRFEVDLRSGSFVLRETDLSLNDVFKVPFTRSYNSGDWLHPTKVHAFGKMSNHSFDIAPVGTRNPYTHLFLVLEDGDYLYFDRISDGTGYADAVYRHSETSTPFYNSTIRWNGNGWTLDRSDGSEIIFPESYSAKNMAQGAPTRMRDAQGNLLEIHRDKQRNLVEIRTPHGHWMKFEHDSQERITRAEDDTGHWTRYSYDTDGMLADVIHSSGHERHYKYADGAMIEVRDEKGSLLLRNSYDGGLVVQQEFSNGDIYKYGYQWPRNGYYPDQVKVSGPRGLQQDVSVAESVPQYIKNLRKNQK